MKKLSQFISLWTIGAIALVVSVSAYFYVDHATGLMIEHESRANRDITRSVEREVWPRFQAFVEQSRKLETDQLLASEEVIQLDDVVRHYMRNTNILKAKIYNVDGVTIFSSQRNQIGVNKSDNPGFQDAIRGKVRSYLAFRSEFHAFEKIIVDRDIISSYMPLGEGADKKPVGVIEVYSDVTDLVNRIRETRKNIIIFGFFGFLFLFMIVQFVSLQVSKAVKHFENQQWEVTRLAYTDGLTGLPNRNEFNNRLKRLLEDQRSTGGRFTLMYLDLDGFKQINDKHGHSVGDEVLMHVGMRISHALRNTDTVYRIGGDEFTVILPGLDDPKNAEIVAGKLIREIARPIACDSADCRLTASIGVVLHDDSHQTMEQMVDAADKAMYAAKQAGANQYTIDQS